MKFRSLFLAGLLVGIFCSARAQVDSTALSILDKAIGFVYTEGKGAIYYETIAQNVADPMDIFKLPLYKVDKGGHWFLDGNKFEIKTAGNIALCDGKLMCVIDEDTQVMYVDSVREEPLVKPKEGMPDMEEMIDKEFGEGTVNYLGEEVVKGITCHKIQAYFEKMNEDYILYWVSKKTNDLILMAEKTDNSFTVYEIKEVKKVPENYNYTIVLPQEELNDFHGFQVTDMRYARNFLETGIDAQ